MHSLFGESLTCIVTKLLALLYVKVFSIGFTTLLFRNINQVHLINSFQNSSQVPHVNSQVGQMQSNTGTVWGLGFFFSPPVSFLMRKC